MTSRESEIAPVDALVLAGGINHIPLYQGHRPGYKALLPLSGKPAIRFVLNALEGVPQVRRRVIVGPPELREALPGPGAWELLPAGETVVESLFTGLKQLREAPEVLCITADLPLLRSDSVADFLRARALKGEGQLFWALVPREAFTGPFARSGKGFNRFRDLAVCHGNLYLLDPRALLASPLGQALDRLYGARKSTLRAALVLGPKVGLGYLVGVKLLRAFTLEQMAALVSRRLGLQVEPVLLEHPEITLDVDEPEDYALVRELLEG